MAVVELEEEETDEEEKEEKEDDEDADPVLELKEVPNSGGCRSMKVRSCSKSRYRLLVRPRRASQIRSPTSESAEHRLKHRGGILRVPLDTKSRA